MQAFILMSASCQTADCHVSWLRLSSLPVSCWVFCCMCTYTLSCLPYQALSNLSALCSPLSADLNAPMSLAHWMHAEPCCTEGTVGLSEAGGVLWCLGISWAWRNACGIFCNPVYNLLLQCPVCVPPHCWDASFALVSLLSHCRRHTALGRKQSK